MMKKKSLILRIKSLRDNILTGAVCLKHAATSFYHWLIEQGQFGKILMVDLVHDEICIEYPKELVDVDKKLEKIMEETAAIYCKSVPIPAEAATGSHWIH